jgi:hypothetical protein
MQLLKDVPMDYVASLFLAAIGATCIYAGYKLFCDLPAMNEQGHGASRAAVLLLNMVPGALLALSGTALVTTEARGMLTHRPAMHRDAPPAQGTSWHSASPKIFNHAA